MVLGRQLRSAFTPEALSTFNHTMDEVCTEVLKLINAKFPMPDFVFSHS